MDETDDTLSFETTDRELRQLLGLFDAPAFARRAVELEYCLKRLHARCERECESMFEMVHLRLRQWAGTVRGPEDWSVAFAAPIDSLWNLTGAQAPNWADRLAPPRRRQAIARNLISSLERFNHRWLKFISELNLTLINNMIDQYNHYYILEKECSLGSVRLAARHFVPSERVSRESLLAKHPLIPVPTLSQKHRKNGGGVAVPPQER